jgi:hypothetical protein
MKIIGVHLSFESLGLMKLLEALGKAIECRFEKRTFGDDVGVDAWLICEANQEVLSKLSNINRPCFVVIRGNKLDQCIESPIVKFSNNPLIPKVLRGSQIKLSENVFSNYFPKWFSASTVLASMAGAPIWVSSRGQECDHHYVPFSISELNNNEPLFKYFSGKNFFCLLPLIIFLRSLSCCNRWDPIPLQACFIFDDPNLHWHTYGFINFAEILKSAQIHNYHVAFATIPLDTYFFNRRTASLFKEHSDRLSLLIHGNDHTKNELSQFRTDKEGGIILQQALQRIARFEKRSGIKVSKVMTAPHGACTENFLSNMARLKFEGACISRGSLYKYNNRKDFIQIFGMRPIDNICDLPVFPRISLCGDSLNDILVAAVLNQPVIMSGHHKDVKEGFGILEKHANFINSLDTVRWLDLNGIFRSYYRKKVEGDCLRLKLLSRRIEIKVPREIFQIQIEPPKTGESSQEYFSWRYKDLKSDWRFKKFRNRLSVRPGEIIEIAYRCEIMQQVSNKKVRKFHFLPVFRRIITEMRDRIIPVLR